MTEPLIQSEAGVLAVLAAVCAFFFLLASRTGWKLFDYLPPLIFIYVTPLILSNTGVLPRSSPVYGSIRALLLPMMLALLLIKVNVGAAVRVLGRGIFVMLFGTLGIMVGAPIAFLIVKGGLGPDGWKAFGVLSGSWIGGTGQMAGAAEMIELADGTTEYGLALLADNVVYVVWLPIMLASKGLAGWFARFTRVDPERLKRMDAAIAELDQDTTPPATRDFLYLFCIGTGVTWLAVALADVLPELGKVVSTGTWRILIVSTVGIALSFTPAHRIRGSHEFAMALVYMFVARMGATGNLDGIAGQAVWFLAGAFIWIFIHGGFCLLGAKLFKVDVHTAAIASAANVGGAASAPIVAAHHKESLVPASILMAMVGYAIGTYAALLTARICQWLA